MVAFLLIGALLGTVAVRALFSLERLMAQSSAGASLAIELSTDAQSLRERSENMERSARQSLVLRDAVLRANFDDTAQHARDIVERLQDNEVTPQRIQEWRDQLQAITALLDGEPETALEREQAVASAFRALDGHNVALGQEVQAIIARRNVALQMSLDRSREQLTQQVTGSILLAALLALAFGVWLARPFKRLEQAIAGLGQNQLDRAINIAGPRDVRRVSQQLEWLRIRLTELDDDKARFLRHVSHELKTPLASLHEGVAVLGDGVAGALTPSQAEVVHILRHNTDLLQQQIEALLSFNAAAFDAKQLQREPTNVRSLLEAQIEEQRLNWQSRGLVVRVEGEAVTLPLDRKKMSSAVGNLLLNAIRFSPAGASIVLRLAQDADGVGIDIIDQGPGVAQADWERIFEPFYRGERQPVDAVRGTGIGLSIVQEYVKAHGGRVRLVRSRPNTTHFRIELPHAH
ncbi:ATP-binding protein [Hydrogenophaga sp. PAMC20947]|uniref:ATP-binding protein n=1 Tax=Hydrogenophaga sp. PAMC20947 TaxID=2565558 RepID=UPI00109DE221|nr:ATP-binding protein [Hydrogenophaga sp. PAMC20947]QCB48853.1 two-component sensor histidine kinase [Hydrogenophaga sp. PAMC20947]